MDRAARRARAVVQRAPVCSPCFQRTCTIGYRCLDAIAVADVDASAARSRREAAARGVAR
jgi:hypothetical protein